ncbi:DUF5682 family protein [Streptomyces sp. B1866]|uniref:DUF5682 family protein n=1 Tax=Streptomyces sp. B1866 TaxID=3075431 RepID=UPI00289137E1|nr:DUF5682 family protein [Streptomyces sp. B1866]MDT3396262.1 DUF5682 family protein [Streptomyces sp. B1866]
MSWPLLLGVRHHGPGSARAVRAALDRCRPSAVLIEGPPEADALVEFAADERMRPPVALLAHVADDPGRAAFWPMADFSPEWVAIRWALGRGVPVRFIDLPAAHTLAMSGPGRTSGGPPGPGAEVPDGTGGRGAEDPRRPEADSGPCGTAVPGPAGPGGDSPESRDRGGREPSGRGPGGREPGGRGGGPGGRHQPGAGPRDGGPGLLPVDPLAVLAEAAGYDDPERWWEDAVEHRGTGGTRRGAAGDAVAAPGAVGPAGTGGRTLGADSGGGPERPGPVARGGSADQVGGPARRASGPPGAVAGGPVDDGLAAGEGPAEQEGPTGSGGPAGGEGPAVEGDSAAEEGTAAALAPFAALGEAMAVLRAEYGHGGHPHDAVREAHMRLRLRAARREFGERVAVVCGAWHVPALRGAAPGAAEWAGPPTATADRALLKGLPKVKAEVSWVPWTHRRLSRHSGYGAGISSPGWYSHLFHAPDRPVERWMTRVAGLLRAEDYAVSSAHVIEAVRLADTLAVLRGRPLPGLTEAVDAVRAVMCEGSEVPVALVHDRLVVGDRLGEVPESAPAVPLQRDLARAQRSLRLKPEAAERELALDLRKETDAGRSRLLHRLRLLGVDWGIPAASRGSTGTFRETWRLAWEPESSVRVAEAAVWGQTVASAAAAKAEAEAAGAGALADITSLAEQCLLAGLSGALPGVLRALADRAALDADVGHLAQALPALVRSVRYGDVRGTDTAVLRDVALGLAERVMVGLPPACAGLGPEAAEEMRGHIEAVHRSVGLLPDAAGPAPEAAGPPGPPGAADSAEAPDAGAYGGGVAGGGGSRAEAGGPSLGGGLRERWAAVLRGLAGREAVAGALRGRATRLLLDDGRLAEGEAARLMGLALSAGTAPADAAAWIEGFLGGAAGGGMLLVHDERLRALVDGWLTGIPAEVFVDVLPLLRRTFAAYDAGVRRTLGELARRGPAPAGGPHPEGGPGGGPGASGAASGAEAIGFDAWLDPGRAAAVLPTVRLLLGLGGSADGPAGESSGARTARDGADGGGGDRSGTADRPGGAGPAGHAGEQAPPPDSSRTARPVPVSGPQDRLARPARPVQKPVQKPAQKPAQKPVQKGDGA